MREAFIVSTARTGIGRAFRGAFNHTKSPSLIAHAIEHAVERAGITGGDVDDVVIGTVLAAGTAGMNVARHGALAAGLPVSVPAQTMDRQCSSGLMAIATAAKQIIVDNMNVVVAGGQENISAVQNDYFGWAQREADANVVAKAPHAYMPMLETAEFVSKKYGIPREQQDEYALESQARTAQAQGAGRFNAEIVPMTVFMQVTDKQTKETSYRQITITRDEGNRPDTTLEGLRQLKPVIEGGCVTAGNAATVRWGVGLRSDGRRRGCATRIVTSGNLSRLGCSWLRSGGDGDRSGSHPETAQAAWAACPGYRFMGAQRSVCLPSPLLTEELAVQTTSGGPIRNDPAFRTG